MAPKTTNWAIKNLGYLLKKFSLSHTHIHTHKHTLRIFLSYDNSSSNSYGLSFNAKMKCWVTSHIHTSKAKQASKHVASSWGWVAHQNEHESSMMGLQALKWPFVAVTTTTITKLLRGREVRSSVSNKHDKGGTHQLLHHHTEIKFTSPTRRRRRRRRRWWWRRRNTTTITTTTTLSQQ